MCIYSVRRDLVYQIWQIGKTECFAGISQEGLTRETLTRETLVKTSYHYLSWLFAFQSCVEHMLHFVRRLLASYSWKLLCFALCLESSQSLSHTTLRKKSHIKYRIHKIEQNYNWIWHGIKANKNIVVNYNSTRSMWLPWFIRKKEGGANLFWLERMPKDKGRVGLKEFCERHI